jgi:tripartite-type tricarboxylate transporter receptor subunit TctC
MGLDPLGSTPEELAVFLGKEILRWKQIVQDAGVKLEGAR